MKVFQKFVQLWQVETYEPLPRRNEVDLIVSISYTTLPKRLTDATKANLELALKYVKVYPQARLAFSSCSYTFPGADKVEHILQMRMCAEAKVKPIVAKPMVNTVDEAMNIRAILNEKGIHPKCILIVTGELHSRSARYVWEKVFPGARIFIRCTPCDFEVQPDHPVLDQRVIWKWVRSNVLRQVALRCLPLSYVRKIKHKPAPC